MSILYMLGYLILVNWICLSMLWLISLKIKDASIIDIYWGLGFVMMSWTCLIINLFFNETTITTSQWLINIMVTIWGLRLSIHLAMRNLGKGEDLRYVKMRERASSDWRFLSYVRVFMFQGFLQMLLMIPILLVHYYPGQFGMSVFDYFGLLVWAIGFGIETITDMQLTKFRSNATNNNKILKAGLWRYSRHPNYFGDALQWFAFFIISLNSGYLWGAIGPILMVFIFLKLTIGILERSQTRKRPGYEEYTKSTNVFFPGRRR